MRQSQLFTKASKDIDKTEKSINARFLSRAGFIDKLSSGIYTYLPLGLRVARNIENIIREEIEKIGGIEILMPALHPKDPWEKTGRWQKYAGEDMFKLKNRLNKEYALGWTHEEIITPLLQKFVFSYKDLPRYVFQIQTKFRDELRSKSGLLRNIEFLMKDLYSFHTTEQDLHKYYEKAKRAYFSIFNRIGIGKKTYLTFASGGAFSKYSHEFQTLSESGEDIIYICQKCKLAINREIKKETPACPECHSKKFKDEKSIETGNIFKLGTKYSQAFDFKFKDKDGKEKLVFMGCYGIGVGRAMGTIVELHHDDKGIIWPESVAPFKVHLLSIEGKNQKVKQLAEKLYKALSKNKIEVLYDDREESAGTKLIDSDLIGIPLRVVVSPKTLERKSVEIKERKEKKASLIREKELFKILKK